MTATHTPVPWTVLDGGAVADSPHFAIEAEPMTQYRIADVYDEANARLIAAAPALLAALKAQASWKMRDGSPCACPLGENEDEPHGKMGTHHSTACEMLRAAIAQAEGDAK